MPVIAPLLMTVVLTVHAGQQPASATPPPAAESQWTDDRPITRFFQNLGRDFSHVPSSESAAVLIVGASVAATAHTQDAAAARWVGTRGDSRAASVGHSFGGRSVQAGGALVLWVIGKATHNAQMSHIGSDLIRAQAVSGLLTISIKAATDRERPNGERHAFPSGHTSAAFTTAAVLQQHYGWKVGSLAYAAAGFVGWSRVRSNQHWMSDVAMGSAVGILSARAVTRGHLGGWIVTPVKTQGGMAVFVTRRPAQPAR